MDKAKRNTIQRKVILEAVRQLKCHASVEDIYVFISKDYPLISKATVYRNLNLLAKEGEISKVTNIDGVERFDHLTYKHYHVKCTQCGKLADVEMDYIDDLTTKVKDAHGFIFNTHDIIFNGLCPTCLKKTKGGE